MDVSTDNSVASFYELLLPLLIDLEIPLLLHSRKCSILAKKVGSFAMLLAMRRAPSIVSTLAMSASALVSRPCYWPKMLIPFFHASVV